MLDFFKKPLHLFITLVVLLTLFFFLFPVNLFDGVIEIENGLIQYEEPRPLSLSYFIGIGYEDSEMEFVKDFYLTTKGIFMAFVFILGIPGLISYRVYLGQKKTNSR